VTDKRDKGLEYSERGFSNRCYSALERKHARNSSERCQLPVSPAP
jgi:hypothetical protein